MSTVFALRTERLSKSYGDVEALREVSLTVPEGIIYGVLGANGAGKSTLIDILSTIKRPTGGRATVRGWDVVKHPVDVKTHMGVLPEGGAGSRPHWFVVEYLRFFASLKNVGIDQSIIERLRIGSLLHMRLGDLSSGQKRKVELARTFLGRPQIVLLDEPTKELDLQTRRVVWSVLQALVQEQGVTILISSHDVFEIKELCQAVAVLHEGSVSLTLDQLKLAKHTPGSLETTLIQAMG